MTVGTAVPVDRTAVVRDIFDHLDQNKDGYLDGEEVLLLVRNLKGTKANHRKVARLMRKMDTNGDGKVDPEEFGSMILDMSNKYEDAQFLNKMDILKRGRRQVHIDFLFRLFDTDGDGEMSEKEFLNCVKLGLKSSKKRPDSPNPIMDKFALLDKDGSNALDLKEFSTYMDEIFKIMDERKFAEAVSKLRSRAIGLWRAKAASIQNAAAAKDVATHTNDDALSEDDDN
eukprot:CAMPEP_0197541206 /NCGR_PEP_ID=MMETSP1318-20131121/67021_1 /TAXON_ID=552666 /ORGANISM="Partenskyella glossopodia, Strain RCC365" /LENGTH=227 /DNA_ID=CAMNT_0043100355 /DNA_START=549 /DNA_END=1232 /DNA_ORIENTATION=+